MNYAAILLLLFSVAAAPMAPAAALATPSAEACAAQCCETDPDCCDTACPCPPLSCHVPVMTSVINPAGQPVFIFTPDHATSLTLSDDTCSVRTSRPPVPPPRA